jgi:hypothetical protein
VDRATRADRFPAQPTGAVGAGLIGDRTGQPAGGEGRELLNTYGNDQSFGLEALNHYVRLAAAR